jgi:hypothetical protein
MFERLSIRIPIILPLCLGLASLAHAGISYHETGDGDLSTDAAAPTALDFGAGSNTIVGTVSNSNDPGGDRDFITFELNAGEEINSLMLNTLSPDNIAFIGLNAGPTGFVPAGATVGEFLAGIHVDASSAGSNLLPLFVSQSVTTNSLSEARLGPGSYTLVIQQTSDIVQSYGLDAVVSAAGISEPRDVQISKIDFTNGLLVLTNFGPTDVDLSGWRFCSHDADQLRVYTSSAGMNGVTIESGTSIQIHFNDDAPVGPDFVNRTTLGNFALPLDSDAYGIQLYFPGTTGSISFADSTLIADHVQWRLAGGGAGLSETRTAQAVGQFLWTATGDFVETTVDSTAINLLDLLGGRLHGPADYEAVEPMINDCPWNTSGDDEVGVDDFFALLQNWGPCPAAPAECPWDTAGDGGPDGEVGVDDFFALLQNWGPCP